MKSWQDCGDKGQLHLSTSRGRHKRTFICRLKFACDSSTPADVELFLTGHEVGQCEPKCALSILTFVLVGRETDQRTFQQWLDSLKLQKA